MLSVNLENAKISQPNSFTPFKVDIVINWLTIYQPKFLLGYIINRCFKPKLNKGQLGLPRRKDSLDERLSLKHSNDGDIANLQINVSYCRLHVACLNVNNLKWAKYVLNNLHHCWRGQLFFAKIIYFIRGRSCRFERLINQGMASIFKY